MKNDNVVQINEMNDEDFSLFIENEISPLILSNHSDNVTSFPEPKTQPVLNMKSLRNRYPHLTELCDHFERAGALSSLRKDHIFSLTSPVILVGSPGCGKTDFALHVAAQLHAESYLFDCACASAGFLLTGMSSAWRGGKRGIIHELVHGVQSCAKPFLILDEIDKANGNSQHPILPVLGGLFEPTTAAKFIDEYEGESVDANSINFICTANDLSGVPTHILDRCEIIKCPLPDRDQQVAVMKSLWNDLRCDLFAADFEISSCAWKCFSNIGLRSVKRILTHAVALCVIADKKVICESEIDKAVSHEDGVDGDKRIGFI